MPCFLARGSSGSGYAGRRSGGHGMLRGAARQASEEVPDAVRAHGQGGGRGRGVDGQAPRRPPRHVERRRRAGPGAGGPVPRRPRGLPRGAGPGAAGQGPAVGGRRPGPPLRPSPSRTTGSRSWSGPTGSSSDRLGRLQPQGLGQELAGVGALGPDRKSTRLNSSHQIISYAVFCLKKKKKKETMLTEPKIKKEIIQI